MSSLDASDIELSGLLSEATLSALQLHEQPFTPIGPDDATFIDDITAEQLADVKQALITGDDLLLILGENGAGKSVLLSQLSADSGLRIQCFAVKGSPRFSTLNLFAGMLEAFKRPPPEKLKDILDDLIPCLQTMVTRNTLSAIVLDDAHEINETELTQLLSGMLYVNSQDETLMRVALAAPGAFEDRIPDLLPEGADLPYSSLTIEGMSPQRASRYLEFRLQQAGFDGELPFSESEMITLVEQSGGLPHALQRAAANALNHEYGAVEDTLPAELLSEKGDSFLHTRTGKLALGILATLLIVGGLLMFMPGSRDTDDARYTVAERDAEDAPELRIVEENPVEPVVSNSDSAETRNDAGDQVVSVAEAPEPNSPAAASGSGSDAGAAGQSVAEAVTVSPDSQSATDDQSESTQTPVVEGEGSSQESAQDTMQESAQDTTQDSAQNTAQNTAQDTAQSSTAESTEVSPQASSDQTSEESTQDSTGNSQPDATSAAADSADQNTATTTDDSSGNASGQQAGANAPDDAAGAEPGTNTGDADAPDPDAIAGLESPTWILVQDPARFTVQMSASRDRPSVENFLRRNQQVLPVPNSIYTFERDGDTWYALLHGLFDSIADARAAVEKMPASAQTNQPWIRNVGRVQAVLRDQ